MRHAFIRRCGAFAISVAFLYGSLPSVKALPPDEQALYTQVIDRHRTSRDIIQTTYCKVRFEIWNADTANGKRVDDLCSSEFWYAQGKVRLKVNELGQDLEYVYKDTIRTSLLLREGAGQKEFAASKGGFRSCFMHRSDGWVRGLLVVNVPAHGDSVPFERLAELAKSITKIWTQNENGRELIVVRLFFDDSTDQSNPWHVDVAFDPSVNYLIRKVTHYAGSSVSRSSFYRQEEVVSFVEPLPGIYFPERIVGRSGNDEKMTGGGSLAVLSDIKVNVKLPTSTFVMKFPRGIYMTDSLRNARYRIDQNGNSIGDIKELSVHPPPPPASSSRTDEPTPHDTVEEPPPSRLNYWIIAASVGCLLAAAVVVVRRNRHGD